jgi:hypothetical protein
MKKILSVIAILSAITLLFTSCTMDEMAFYNTYKEMAAIKDYSFTGDITAKINTLTSSDESTQGVFDSITKAIQGKSIMFDGVVNQTQNKYSLNVNLKSSDGSNVKIVKLIVDGDYIYISKEEAVAYMPATLTPTESTISNVVYLKYSISDIMQYYIDLQSSSMIPSFTNPNGTDFALPTVMGYDDGFYSGYFDAKSGITANPAGFDPLSEFGSDADYIAQYADGYAAGFAAYVPSTSTSTSYDPMISSLANMMKSKKTMSAELQAKITAFTDDIVNNFFKTFSLGLVKKDSNCKYSANLTVANIIDSITNVTTFIQNNPDAFKTSLKTFVTSLSAENLAEVGITGIDKAQMISDIDSWKIAPTTSTVDPYVDIKKSISDSADVSLNYSLQKTGSQSFATNGILSVVTKSTDLPINADLSVTLNYSINGDLANNIQTQVSSINADVTTASINITVDDKNAVEAGIFVSTKPDMSDAKQIKGTLDPQTGKCVVNLSSLNGNTTFYYSVYTVDVAGNLLKQTGISNFVTKTATTKQKNPETGASNTIPSLAAIAFAVSSVAIIYTRKKATK